MRALISISAKPSPYVRRNGSLPMRFCKRLTLPPVMEFNPVSTRVTFQSMPLEFIVFICPVVKFSEKSEFDE